MIVLLSKIIINIFDFSMFKQAQTEALYAEEKSHCIVLGTYFAKAKTNSQLFLDSRRARGALSSLLQRAGAALPSSSASSLPCPCVRSRARSHHTPAAEHFPPSDTAQPLGCLMVVLETASTYTMAG